jgi:hypothetical protein
MASPGVSEFYPFDRRNEFLDNFGPINHDIARGTKLDALLQLFLCRLDHGRVGMAKHIPSVSSVIINKFVPIYVPDVRSATSAHGEGERGCLPSIMGHTAGNDACRFGKHRF